MSKAVNSPHDRPRTINTAISGGTTMGASRGGRPRSPFTERGTSIHPAKFPSTAITMSEVWRALSRGGYLGERKKEALHGLGLSRVPCLHLFPEGLWVIPSNQLGLYIFLKKKKKARTLYHQPGAHGTGASAVQFHLGIRKLISVWAWCLSRWGRIPFTNFRFIL